MKKTTLLIFIILLYNTITAQTLIEISKNYTVLLLFNSNVSESILGGDADKFFVTLPQKDGTEYNKKIIKLSYNMVALDKEANTNYTVITENGKGYEFILKLVDKPKKFNHNISQNYISFNMHSDFSYIKNDSIEVINNKAHYFSKDVKTEISSNVNSSNMNFQDIETLAKFLIHRPIKTIDFFDTNSKVTIRLKGLYYNDNNIYFSFSLRNRSNTLYDLRFVNYNITDSYNKSSSNQSPASKPILLYNQPNHIQPRANHDFVVVFKKFTLDKKRAINIKIEEEKGNRKLSLLIPSDIINNPYKF